MADKDVEYWQQMKRFFIAKRDEQADKKRTTSTAPARISYQENMKRTGRTLAADSGIVSRFKPAKYIKPQFDKLFSKLNALWTREGGGNSYNSTASTAQGSEYFASPAVARTMLWQERWEHRANIATYNIIYRSDPRAFKSIQMYAQEATRGGVTITISSKNKESLIPKAQYHANKVKAIIDPDIENYAKMVFVEGDLYIQAVLDPTTYQLVDILQMPSVSMERLSDDMDQFRDPARAFAQVDTYTQAEVATFSEAIMYHLRWDRNAGERYGSSGLAALSRFYWILKDIEESQVRRRLARASISRLWNIGTKDDPGQDADVQKFKDLNGINADGTFGDGENNKDIVGRDFFSNGLSSVDLIEGDPNIEKIDDIRYMESVFTSALPTPMTLCGLHPDAINRDTLTDMRAEWLKMTKLMSDRLSLMVEWLFRLSLLLDGINPADINYDIHFSASNLETQSELIDRSLKLFNNIVDCGSHKIWVPFMTRRDVLQVMSDNSEINNIDEKIKELDDMVAQLTSLNNPGVHVQKIDQDGLPNGSLDELRGKEVNQEAQDAPKLTQYMPKKSTTPHKELTGLSDITPKNSAQHGNDDPRFVNNNGSTAAPFNETPNMSGPKYGGKS